MASYIVGKPQKAEVTWEDAHGSDGTISSHEVDHTPYVYTTLGYLVRSDEIGVSVAHEIGEDGRFRQVTFIPRKMVLKETVYPRKRRTSNDQAIESNTDSPTDLHADSQRDFPVDPHR